MKTNLQALRKSAGFKSAAAFAEYAGISVGTYSAIFFGTKKKGHQMLVSLCLTRTSKSN